MRKILIALSLISIVLFLVGCSEDRLTEPQTSTSEAANPLYGLDPEILAMELIQTAGWEIDPDIELPDKVTMTKNYPTHFFPSFTREEIADQIAHYTFEVQVGDGPYEMIRIHRVVKERRPFKPVKTSKNLFMLPGDGASFPTAFLLSTLSDAVPSDHAMPIYLARNGVDVWGLDMGWTLVPAEVTDLSFMADWGLQKDIDDLRLAGGLARFARLFTGHWDGPQGTAEEKGRPHFPGKMNLLGWSRGGMIGYGCMSEESQLPRWQRQFGGYIPVDIWAKTLTYNDEECAYAADLQAMLDAGTYADDTGAFLGWMVEQARLYPDEISEVFGEPFTNRMAAIAVGSQTYILSPIPEYYSIVAGTFDADGLPEGLVYTPVDFWFDFVANWAPYEPVLMEMETEWAVCGDPAHPVPFYDHLGDITVPVMYVGGHGGFGEEGYYTLDLLGSTDITTLVVSINGDPWTDFAHADLFLAENAPDLVWEPVLQWLRQH